MTIQDIISKAFFDGYGLMFKYHKTDTGEHQQRMLVTVSDLKYNADDEILVGGCISTDGARVGVGVGIVNVVGASIRLRR